MDSADRAYLDAHRLMYGDLGERVATGAILFRDTLMLPGFTLPPVRIAPVSPYGKCVGQMGRASRRGFDLDFGQGVWIFLQGRLWQGDRPALDKVDETLLHEMIHADLRQHGHDASHRGEPWALRCQAISDRLGLEVRIERPRSVRYGPRVTTRTPPGCLSYAELALWPGKLLDGGPSLRDRLQG